MATKGTFHQKRGDIGIIDWLMEDPKSRFSGLHHNTVCVVINALEHYREALVNDVLVEVNAKGMR